MFLCKTQLLQTDKSDKNKAEKLAFANLISQCIEHSSNFLDLIAFSDWANFHLEVISHAEQVV